MDIIITIDESNEIRLKEWHDGSINLQNWHYSGDQWHLHGGALLSPAVASTLGTSLINKAGDASRLLMKRYRWEE